MKILLHGLNYAPEELGIGKYSGEMVQQLAAAGHECVVVTTPPYYPQWRVWEGYRSLAYRSEQEASSGVRVTRCPLWVPRKTSGLKRVIHLASFGISSLPATLWHALRFRPDVIMTVEPAAFCMPTTLLASRVCGAKAWLHVQDFEVDAAFDLGILKAPLLRKTVLAIESFMMGRFDRVSSISPNMLRKLESKKVRTDRIRSFPNWVDCGQMKPIADSEISQSSLRRKFGLPDDKFIALYAGTIGAKQGIEIIVEAARQLTASGNSEVHFVICGHGSAHAKLCTLADGVGNVQMLPVQPFEQFNELMNCADVHLLPQRADAADLVMPSKLTGMLATGRAVIGCATRGTQIAEVIEGRGIVVPPGDADNFAAAVKLLSDEPERCNAMGEAARRYAVEHLSRDAILEQFEADLLELRAVSARADSVRGHAADPDVKPASSTPRPPHFGAQTDGATSQRKGVEA